jgi:hypothetical protein
MVGVSPFDADSFDPSNRVILSPLHPARPTPIVVPPPSRNALHEIKYGTNLGGEVIFGFRVIAGRAWSSNRGVGMHRIDGATFDDIGDGVLAQPHLGSCHRTDSDSR